MYLKLIFFVMLGAGQVLAQEQLDFGDDSSQWAGDGDCDDRRFFGPGMAAALDRADTGRDATDCQRAFTYGQVRQYDPSAARAATQCAAINFGDDSSEWARDGQCDDIRFEGEAASDIQTNSDLGRDATDCQQACKAGAVYLRNY